VKRSALVDCVSVGQDDTVEQGGRSMTMEFYSIVFPNVGEMYTDTPDPFARVKVRLYFRNIGTDLYTPIEMDTKVAYRPDSTISEIYESALAEAKHVIAAANALLSECNLSQLQALSTERMQQSD
jgi:hypothetical protein